MSNFLTRETRKNYSHASQLTVFRFHQRNINHITQLNSWVESQLSRTNRITAVWDGESCKLLKSRAKVCWSTPRGTGATGVCSWICATYTCQSDWHGQSSEILKSAFISARYLYYIVLYYRTFQYISSMHVYLYSCYEIICFILYFTTRLYSRLSPLGALHHLPQTPDLP